jgi:LacI family transcriptional regulator
MVTSRDVARHAGVSQATVSRVLNNSGYISPDARERVLKALVETGYVPNAQARAMRTARSGAIGIVTSEIQNPFLPYLLDELTKTARARGLTSIVWNDDEPGTPMAAAGAASGSVDGVLFMTAKTNTSGVGELAAKGFPVLYCNRAPENATVDVVTSDHRGSGRLAAEYFLRHGRTRIAATFGSPDTFASPARQSGFQAALAEGGVELPARRVHLGETAYETGFAAAQRLVESGDLPDALFCASDIIAYGSLDAFRLAGVRVPDDLWVCGIDGLPMSSWAAFDLTTQVQDVAGIAEQAIDVLLSRIGGSHREPRRIVLPTSLVVRGSTASAR